MKTIIRTLLIILFVGMIFSCEMEPRFVIGTTLTAPLGGHGRSPGDGFIWIEGEWFWNGADYGWRDGYWSRPHNGYHWQPGNWRRRGGGWYWRQGKWR